MTAVMHSPLNLENFPSAQRGRVDTDYAALALKVRAARRDLQRVWHALPEEIKSKMYAQASEILLHEMSFGTRLVATVRVTTLTMALSWRGQLEAFSGYMLELRDLWSDVLSLSEEDSPQWKADVRMALEGVVQTSQTQKPLKGPDDIRAYLEQL